MKYLLQPVHVVEVGDGQYYTVGQDGKQDKEVKHLVRAQIHCYSPHGVPSWQKKTSRGGREACNVCGVKPSGQHNKSLAKKQSSFHIKTLLLSNPKVKT